jgi:hypothetical protein
MPEQSDAFKTLLDALETVIRADHRPMDAIDRLRASPPRQTAVTSLRDIPVVARFHEDLTNGLIRIDTANVIFRLITDILSASGRIP